MTRIITTRAKIWFKLGLAFAIGFIIGWAWGMKSFVAKEVGANPPPDACNANFDYTKTGDFNDSRVDINFQDNDDAITVTAKSGYSLVSVQLDVEDDGHSGYYTYALTSGVKFNPNPGYDIDGAKVRVTKVCRAVCNDEAALNYEAVVVGQTYADNKLCEYPSAGQCSDVCGITEPYTVPNGEGGVIECGATPACYIPHLCLDANALNYNEDAACRYVTAASAPQGPTCKDLGVWSPTITKVGRIDKDTVFAEWTNSSENADSYLVWYGLSKDKLDWNTTVKGLRAEISGEQLTGHVWFKVAAKSEGCVGNFSVVTDP